MIEVQTPIKLQVVIWNIEQRPEFMWIHVNCALRKTWKENASNLTGLSSEDMEKKL